MIFRTQEVKFSLAYFLELQSWGKPSNSHTPKKRGYCKKLGTQPFPTIFMLILKSLLFGHGFSWVYTWLNNYEIFATVPAVWINQFGDGRQWFPSCLEVSWLECNRLLQISWTTISLNLSHIPRCISISLLGEYHSCLGCSRLSPSYPIISWGSFLIYNVIQHVGASTLSCLLNIWLNDTLT